MFEIVKSFVSDVSAIVRSAVHAVSRQPWLVLLALSAFAVALW